MDKRSDIRRHFQTEATNASTDKQHHDRTAQLQEFESTVVSAFNTLIRYLDGKTTKTEVMNQLSSISTPDVDKVVVELKKLDKDVLANKLDLKPVTDGLNGLKRELSLIPKTLPKIPEAKDSVKVTNLSEIKLDTSAVEKAIKGLKLDVKAPIINTEKTDIKPLQDVMLDLLKAINKQKPTVIPKFPEIHKTDLSKVEKNLDKSNKLLKEIVDKPIGGGGGGGGNGTPYIDSTGRAVNVELETDGSIPVTVISGGGGDTTLQDQLAHLINKLSFLPSVQGIASDIRVTMLSGVITSITTVSTVTTVGTLTNQTNIGGYAASNTIMNQMNTNANQLRQQIITS